MTLSSQKILIALSVLLVGIALTWGAYLYGYRTGAQIATNSAQVATNSSQQSATGSADFIGVVARDDLFDLRDVNGAGVATGTVKAVSATQITLLNKRGDQTGYFKVDAGTNYFTVKDKKLVREGSLADVTVGMLIQISFKDSANDHLAVMVIR